MVEWREDLRRCLLQAGVKDTPTSFVFTDAQVVMESFLEDVNNILNAGADSASKNFNFASTASPRRISTVTPSS